MIRTTMTLIPLLLLTASAQATVPERMHYQGYLTNAEGEAVHCPDAVTCPDQSFAVTFRLYDSAEGGDPLWLETHLNVPVVRGTFDVVLGADLPLDPAQLADPAWLGVEINGAGEMAPRQRIVSSAFALRAGNAESAEVASLADDADRLGGLDAAEYARLSDLEGLCVTDDELTAVLTEESYLDIPDLEAYLTEEGYVPGAPFSGQFADLEGVPDDLLDGDDDTLAMMSCEASDVLRFDGFSWVCDVDWVLTEEQVDGMVSNNGYALSELLAAVATSGSYADLDDLPPALTKLSLTADGSLSFGDTTIINAAGEWVGAPTGLQGPPGEQGEPGQDGAPGEKGDDGALAGLMCAEGEFLKVTADGWGCTVDPLSVAAGSFSEATLEPGEQLSVALTPNSYSSVQVWMNRPPFGLVPVATYDPLTGEGCKGCGSGVDGSFVPAGNTTIEGGTYQFTEFRIPAGVTVTVTGNSPLEVVSQQSIVMEGALLLDADDANGSEGGQGAAGGGKGGKGYGGAYVNNHPEGCWGGTSGSGSAGGGGGSTCHNCSLNKGGDGGGGGLGAAGQDGAGGQNPGSGGAQLVSSTPTQLHTGSGGGGGGGRLYYSGGMRKCPNGGGGGGGGGAIYLAAPSIKVSGTVSATGGDGTCGEAGGGGGSGGMVWLEGWVVEVSGAVSVAGGSGCGGGGDGGAGVIRIDSNETVGAGASSAYGGEIEKIRGLLLRRDADDNVVLSNNTQDTMDLIVTW